MSVLLLANSMVVRLADDPAVMRGGNLDCHSTARMDGTTAVNWVSKWAASSAVIKADSLVCH